jgi:transposase
MAMLADSAELVIGVDTDKHTHTAAVVTAATGAMVAQATVPATPAGYRQLLELADQHHGQRVWAIEGTGGDGAGLTRFLHASGRAGGRAGPAQAGPRRHGAKSDPLDAVRPPARGWAVISWPSPERPVHEPRCRCGWPPVARRSRPPAMPNANCTRWSSPHPRSCGNGSGSARPASSWPPAPGCASRPAGTPRPPPRPRPWAAWPVGSGSEAADHRQAILVLIRAWRPDLLARQGSARSWPPPCCAPGPVPDAAAPMPPSPCWAGPPPSPPPRARPSRVRLNRSGDRQLNQALYSVVLTRLRTDPATRADATRRRAQGKTNREIKRCLVRYVARQLYRLLETQPSN